MKVLEKAFYLIFMVVLIGLTIPVMNFFDISMVTYLTYLLWFLALVIFWLILDPTKKTIFS